MISEKSPFEIERTLRLERERDAADESPAIPRDAIATLCAETS